MPNIEPTKDISTLYNNIKNIINTSNNTIILSYWKIGKRLKKEIVVTLSRELNWSHFIEFIKIKDKTHVGCDCYRTNNRHKEKLKSLFECSINGAIAIAPYRCEINKLIV